MKVVLLRKYRKLGDVGDICHVKPGYGRNYLIPYGFAAWAGPKEIEDVQNRLTELRGLELKKLEAAQARAKIFEKLKITISAPVHSGTRLYGGISRKEIIRKILEANKDLKAEEILIDRKVSIHETGIHKIPLGLHEEVRVEIEIEIIPAESH